jgi:hypothetical protein
VKLRDEETLEMAGVVLVQALAVVQKALGEFWEKRGKPSQSLLDLLREQVTSAVRGEMLHALGERYYQHPREQMIGRPRKEEP